MINPNISPEVRCFLADIFYDFINLFKRAVWNGYRIQDFLNVAFM